MAPGPAPKSLTILVVEDNADARDALRALLESDGHDVDTAEDAEQALATLATRPRDVVIIDIGLPHMDGYELARRLRTSPATSAVRLVALTGYGQPQDRRRSQEAGFDAHLVKPVDEHVLSRVLAE